MIWDDRKGRPYAKGKSQSPDFGPGFLRMHLYHSREMRLGLRDVSRVCRSIIQEDSPGIGFPHPS